MLRPQFLQTKNFHKNSCVTSISWKTEFLELSSLVPKKCKKLHKKIEFQTFVIFFCRKTPLFCLFSHTIGAEFGYKESSMLSSMPILPRKSTKNDELNWMTRVFRWQFPGYTGVVRTFPVEVQDTKLHNSCASTTIIQKITQISHWGWVVDATSTALRRRRSKSGIFRLGNWSHVSRHFRRWEAHNQLAQNDPPNRMMILSTFGT